MEMVERGAIIFNVQQNRVVCRSEDFMFFFRLMGLLDLMIWI
jgi:hypothetical protein